MTKKQLPKLASLAAVATACAFMTQSVSARDWPEVAGWRVQPGQCAVRKYVPGGRALQLTLPSVYTRGAVAFLDREAGLEVGSRQRMTLMLNGRPFTIETRASSAELHGGPITPEMLRAFEKANSIKVFDDKSVLVMDVRAGSQGEAVKLLRECVAESNQTHAKETSAAGGWTISKSNRSCEMSRYDETSETSLTLRESATDLTLRFHRDEWPFRAGKPVPLTVDINGRRLATSGLVVDGSTLTILDKPELFEALNTTSSIRVSKADGSLLIDFKIEGFGKGRGALANCWLDLLD
jgi:hypothetical protein